MEGKTRTVSWLKPARKAFEAFPPDVQEQIIDALIIAARGEKARIAKPMTGLGSGVFEVALPYRGDAYRTVYAVQMGEDVWVIHAFQKKSTQGIKTPQREIEVIRERISGRESKPQVVDLLTVFPETETNMWAGCQTGRSYITDHLPLLYVYAGANAFGEALHV